MLVGRLLRVSMVEGGVGFDEGLVAVSEFHVNMPYNEVRAVRVVLC